MASIQRLLPEHWPFVLEIYEQGLRSEHATFETVAPTWDAWDAAHCAAARLVAVQEGRVVGWAALSPVSRGPVYEGVAEVSVYVSENSRGNGVGHRLLEALVRESEVCGYWTLQASIFPENAASCRLHERHGFRLIGRRERVAQHRGRWRDTVLYERRSMVVGRAITTSPAPNAQSE